MLLCFVHIPKAAGSTIDVVLRKSFGARHVDVYPFYRRDHLFGPGDLRILLGLKKNICSVAGHCVRPVSGLERVRSDVVYYCFLREPVMRYVSYYHWRLDHGRMPMSFDEWMRDRRFDNWMTKFICGEEDVAAAFQILREKMLVVGLQERFDESLVLLRHAVGDGLLDIHYGRPANVSKRHRVRREIEERMDHYRPILEEANSLDIELYKRVLEELYPAQARSFGPDLDKEVEEFQRNNGETIVDHSALRITPFKALVYKPYLISSRLLRWRSPNRGPFEVPKVATDPAHRRVLT